MPRVGELEGMSGEGSEVARHSRGGQKVAAEGSLRLCAHLCPDLQLHFLPFFFPEGLRVKVLAGVFVVIATLPQT